MLAVPDIARHVLGRLAEIDLERPAVDEERAAVCFQKYVNALGLATPAVRWAPDIRALRTGRVWPATDKEQWPALSQRQTRLFNHSPEPQTLAARQKWAAATEGLPYPEIEPLVRTDTTILEIGLGDSPYVRAVQRVTERLDVRRCLTAGDAAPRTPRMDALIPLADAAAAGLFAYAIGRGGAGDIVAVSRPRIRLDDQGRLHNWDGLPAAEWPNGNGLYFWRGVHMTDGSGRHPDRVTPRRILDWANAERRRVAIKRMGYERFLTASGATVIQQDDYGQLWRLDHAYGGEPHVVVEVTNASAERDGTHRRYFLRVPPTTRTARQGVAWTFGIDRPREYSVVAES
jgi:hypothetical protein